MTVETIVESGVFQLAAAGDMKKNVEKVFCCDLLSIAMSKAPEHAAWVTVMGNKNTLAVASLTDISCIILAEGTCFAEEELNCAKGENITVFTTELPVFDAGLKIQELIV